MANDDHIAVLKKGVDAWKAWRQENPDVLPNLSGADLFEAHLFEAHLIRANPQRGAPWRGEPHPGEPQGGAPARARDFVKCSDAL